MLFTRTQSTIKLFGTEIPEPRVFIDFLGFEKHVRQIRDKRGVTVAPIWYDHAMYYIVDLVPEKFFGTNEEVVVPSCVRAADYEFEIACVVLEEAHVTDERSALDFFKNSCLLTIVNDWSARDIQKHDMEGLGPTNSKFVIGKSFGPKLVPASSISMDENGVLDMKLDLTINGEKRTDSNYQSLYHTHPGTGEKRAWSFPRLMAWLGQRNISMKPGYILGSGTVGDGCIAEFSAKIDPKTGSELQPAKYTWLRDGDVVRMEAQGIGVLENKVRIKEFAPIK